MTYQQVQNYVENKEFSPVVWLTTGGYFPSRNVCHNFKSISHIGVLVESYIFGYLMLDTEQH